MPLIGISIFLSVYWERKKDGERGCDKSLSFKINRVMLT